MKPLFHGALLRGVSVTVLAVSLVACTANPTPLNRPDDVPTAFTAPVQPDAPVWPQAAWWNNFNAEELGPLQELAAKENLDVEIAAARVLQAEARDGVALSSLFPTLGASASYDRVGGNSSIPRASNRFSAGLSASYQQNFFGLEYHNLRAARENLRAARYSQSVVQLSVQAQVADQYFTILSLRERIAINKANVEAAKRILTVTQAKVASGVSSNLDLAEQQAIVAQQQSRLPGLIEAEREARYGLAIMMGRAPERYDVKAQNLDGIVSPKVAPGLPSELLLRRPDIAQAEATLFAAHANVDAARAAFFPSLGLTGDAGYGPVAAIGNLFNPAGFAWSIGASVFQSIFDGGRIAAQKDLANAQEREMLATYRKVVFTAFSDVESALGTLQATNDQLALIEVQAKASAEAFRISELQYREGTIDILSLLNSQQNLFSAQDALAQTKLARLEANLALYNALGGGWEQKVSDEGYKNQLDWWPL